MSFLRMLSPLSVCKDCGLLIMVGRPSIKDNTLAFAYRGSGHMWPIGMD